jgi:site-specific recombinase XerD
VDGVETMKSTTSMMVIPSSDGFLDELVPGASALIVEQLERSGSLGSAHSRRAYQNDVRRFTEWRGERPITKSLVEEYLQSLAEAKASPVYISRLLAGIRWYIRAVLDLVQDNDDLKERLTAEQREEITARAERALLAKKPRGERAAGIETGRYITQPEFMALIEACLADDSYSGVRDRAMFALAYATGPRVHEVAALSVKDVTPVKDDEFMYEVRIIGKGNKERPVKPVLLGGAARDLQEWLLLRGGTRGALFCYITRAGNSPGAKGVISRKEVHLTTDALVKILEKRRREAGLEPLSWHDFRRTYISDLINQYDLVTAQKIIGHSSTNITAKYDRTWQDKARQAARMRVITYQSTENASGTH